jgi:Flp pilus assembly protein TadD
MEKSAGVIFLSVPESLRHTAFTAESETDFSIDPDIPLPVEVPEEGLSAAKAAMEDLSWEMMLSGMLRVLAEGEARSDWLDYYRQFVFALRPGILVEFTEAAILKAKNGDTQLALEILDSLRGLCPGSPSVVLNRALVLEQIALQMQRHGRPETEAAFEEARTAYEQAMSLQPPMQDAFFNSGFFFLGRKDFARARECFAVFAANAGEEDDEETGGEKVKKAQALIKEIDASGLEDEAYMQAYALVRDGEEEAGMQVIRGFIEKQPGVWNGWFVLGWALRRLKRWEDAATAFGKALELGGSGSDTRNELAICLMESGDLKAARRQLETALREDCENLKIISNLGVLAMKSGRKDEAEGFFRTALELDPEDGTAKGYLDLLQTA